MRRVLVAGLFAATLLGACAGSADTSLTGEQPDFTVEATTDPVEELSEPAAPSPQQSTAGAEAMVRYAIETMVYAASTGDTESLTQLVELGCGPCADVMDSLEAGEDHELPGEEVAAGNTHIEGKTARTITFQPRAGGARERLWQLRWIGDGWVFEEVAG